MGSVTNDEHSHSVNDKESHLREAVPLEANRHEEQAKSIYDLYSLWQRQLILAIICSLVFISGYDEDAYLPLIPVMLADFQTTPTLAFSTVSVYLFMMSIFGLLWGTLSDYHGRKMILVCGIGAFFFSTVGCYLSTNIWAFIICRAAQGCFVSVGVVLGQAIVADIYPPDQRARAYGIFYGFYLSSALFGPTIGGWVSRTSHWQINFLLIGIISAILFVACIVFIPETEHHKVRSQLYQEDLSQLSEVKQVSERRSTSPCSLIVDLANISVISYLLVLILTYVSFSCSYLLFSYELARPPYLYAEQLIGMFYLLVATISLFGSILGGVISDLLFKQWSRRWQLDEGHLLSGLIFSVLTSVGLIVYGWSFQLQLPIALPVLGEALAGFSQFASRPGMVAFFMTKYTDHAGSVSAALSFLQVFTTSIAFTLLGNVVQVVQEGMVFTTLSVVNLLATIASCAMVVRAVRSSQHPENQVLR